MHKNLLKVLLLGTVLVSNECFAEEVVQNGGSLWKYLNNKTYSYLHDSDVTSFQSDGINLTRNPDGTWSGNVGSVKVNNVSSAPSSAGSPASVPKVVSDGNPNGAGADSVRFSSAAADSATGNTKINTELSSPPPGSIPSNVAQGPHTANVSSFKSGKELFDTLDEGTQKTIQGSLSDANMKIEDLTQGMVTAVKDGVSLTVANTAQTAANAAASSVMTNAAQTAVSKAITGDMVEKAIDNVVANGVKATPDAVAKELANMTTEGGKKLADIGAEAATGAMDKAAEAGADAASKAAEQAGEKISEEAAQQMGKQAAEQGAQKAGETGTEEACKKAAAQALSEKTISFNYGQYALLIYEALKGNEVDDATKNVKVKGADPMGDSQGQQGGGGATMAMPSTPMSGTTIADSANALIALLNMGKIDLSLLSTDVKKPEQKQAKGVVVAAAGKSGASVKAEGQATTQTTEESLTTDEQREIMHRRALLLGEWATAATQIGEGSNAISRTFYDRAAAFAAAANAAQGSLGGITAITDTDRFVLFEITRGAALSAVQLGLQGAANLNDLEQKEETPAADAPKSNVNAGAGKSQ